MHLCYELNAKKGGRKMGWEVGEIKTQAVYEGETIDLTWLLGGEDMKRSWKWRWEKGSDRVSLQDLCDQAQQNKSSVGAVYST